MRLRIGVVLGLMCLAPNAQAAESATIYGILADEPLFEASRKDFSAKGNVALLTSEGFLTGETLLSSEGGQVLTLEGNVIVIRGSELVKASRLVIDRRNGEWAVFDAEVVVDPKFSTKELYNRDFLGILPEEIAFEARRKEMAAGIRKELQEVREEYVRSRNLERMRRERPGASRALLERYATLLERLVRTERAANPEFEAMLPEARERFEKRRKAAAEVLESHPELAARFRGVSGVGGFAQFKARSLMRDASGTFRIEGASITPCRCGEDGIPLYGLSARSGQVEVEGYARLRGATIEVADVPILYSPFLAFPVKRQRQSGFLRPYFYVSRSARVLGVPFFLTLGEHADTTFTLTDFSGRGLRYDLEGRLQLSPESRLELYGEYIRDRKYLDDSKRYQDRLAKEYAEASASGAPASTLESLEERRRKPTEQRWYLQGSWNLPVTAWGSTKLRGELTSDPSYLSDFGKDDDTSAGLSLLKPPQTAKRMLLQEASAEFYGNQVALSARVQGARDLLSLGTGDTPVRLPKVEFHLLPRRYFDLPLAYDHFLSFERVRRLDGRTFVDLTGTSTIGLPTADNPAPAPVEVAPNGRKDVDEPYTAGDRWQSKGNLVFPLPANDYVNASLSLTAVETQYRFGESPPMKELWPSQTYVRYSAGADMPLFSEFEFFSRQERALEARLRHDVVPSLAFTYIPEVRRSDDFPTEHQAFYVEDNVVSKQEVSFGVRSTWSLFREGFAESGPGPARVPDAESSVGSARLLEEALRKSGMRPLDDGKALFELTQRPEGRRLFRLWSELELESYSNGVDSLEHGGNYVWTGTRLFKKSRRWVMQPFSLGISSSYNFRAAQSEREINERERWRPGQPWTNVEPWGDVLVNAGWSVSPLLPLSGQWNNTWSVQWSRWTKTQLTLSVELPFGLSSAFSKTDTYSPAPDTLTQDQELGYSVSYKPFSWLALSHGWTKKRKWVDGVQTRDPSFNHSEYDHTDTQVISLLNLQDCLDVTLKRSKDYKQREYQATWSLGINMAFFGQRTGAIEVGDALNREIQDQVRR